MAWSMQPLYLSVEVNCMKHEGDNPIYKIEVRFGNYSGVVPILFDRGYRYLGIGSKAGILSAVQVKIETAITDYLKANFDLGD